MSGCRKRRPSPDIGGLIKAKMALLSPLSATGSLPMAPEGPRAFDPIPSELAFDTGPSRAARIRALAGLAHSRGAHLTTHASQT